MRKIVLKDLWPILLTIAYCIVILVLYWLGVITTSQGMFFATIGVGLGTLFLGIVTIVISNSNNVAVEAENEKARYQDVQIRTMPVYFVKTITLSKSENIVTIKKNSDDYLYLETEEEPAGDLVEKHPIEIVLTITQKETSYINQMNFKKVAFSLCDGQKDLTFINNIETTSKIKTETEGDLQIQKCFVFIEDEEKNVNDLWKRLEDKKGEFTIKINYVMKNIFDVKKEGTLILSIYKDATPSKTTLPFEVGKKVTLFFYNGYGPEKHELTAIDESKMQD